jgi:hypothetical protein
MKVFLRLTLGRENNKQKKVAVYCNKRMEVHSTMYDMPPDSTPTTSKAAPSTIGQPLMIPHPKTKSNICIPRISLGRNVNNPHVRETHNYSLVDNLTQSPTAMSVLKVLQTYPNQWKSMFSALGAINPVDTRLITFDLDSGEPRLPALVAFQIPVNIWNITVHRCIIDEGAST